MLIDDYIPLLSSITLLQILGVMSPGPDFAIVLRNSLVYSRQIGFMTVLGITLGIIVHLFYSIIGLAFLIKETTWLFNGIKFLGAGYLFYIGIKALLAQPHHYNKTIKEGQKRPLTNFNAFLMGFSTNVLNVKVMMFFLGLFSVVIEPKTPDSILLAIGFIIIFTTFAWSSFISFIFSNVKIRNHFLSYAHWINRITGIILIYIAIYLSLDNI